MDYEDIAKNLFLNVSKLQDISIILTKLVNQGSIRKLTQNIHQIFEVEHQYMISELKKIETATQAQDSNLLNAQYEMNALIFKRNFSIITQNLIDDIADSYLRNFQKLFGKAKESVLKQIIMNENESVINNELSRMDKKSELSSRENKERDISKEFTPTTIATNLNAGQKLIQASPFSVTETEGNTTNRERLEQMENDRLNRVENPTVLASQSSEKKDKKEKELLHSLTSSSDKKISSKESHQTVASLNRHLLGHMIGMDNSKSKKNTYSPSNIDKTELKHQRNKSAFIETQAYLTSHQNDRPFLQDSTKTTEVKTKIAVNITPNTQKSNDSQQQQRGYSRDSSQEKLNLGQKIGYQNIHGRGSNNQKPSTETASSSYFVSASPNRSYIKANLDPSILDSEFSYAVAGGLIPKSTRKLHDDPNRTPGPGNYDIGQIEKKNSPQSFGKAARFNSFDYSKSQSPGPQYYPTKHFTSKFA